MNIKKLKEILEQISEDFQVGVCQVHEDVEGDDEGNLYEIRIDIPILDIIVDHETKEFMFRIDKDHEKVVEEV